MKKILILIPTLQGGGAERVASILAETLEESYKFSVSVAVYDGTKRMFDVNPNVIEFNEPAKRLIHQKTWTLIRRILKLRQLIKNGKFDIAISFMEASNIVNIMNKVIFCQKYQSVLTVHNNLTSFPTYYTFAIKLLYRLSDLVVAVSHGVRSDLIELDKGLSDKIKVIYNPVQSSFFNNIPKKLNKNGCEMIKILAVGSLTHQKGFDLLISAVSQARNKNKFELKIFGEGEQRTKLQSLIMRHELCGCISLESFTTKIKDEYQDADFFILSSRFEGFGNVLVEAMAAGCYPIAFDVKHGPSEILGKDVGILIPSGDIEKLAKAIDKVTDQSFIVSDEMRRKIKERALLFHIDNFKKSWLELL